MKKIILAVALFTATITVAQNSLFNNVSTTDQYTGYRSVVDTDNDGVYVIGNRQYVVKFKLKTLSTGEGYGLSAIVDKGDKKGTISTVDVVEGNFTCAGYPYESVIRSTSNKEGIVAIGDYVFFLKGVSNDGTSYTSIDEVYIKDGASVGNNTEGAKKKKKKKFSFKDKFKQLKSGGIKIGSYGSEHKALQSQNLRKLITDYLVAMKTKQGARTSEQKQSDKNVANAKEAVVSKAKDAKAAEKAKRDAEWADAKRYNDSVKATPEWQDLQRRKEQNERNYQASQTRTVVTLYNTSGSEVYVGRSGSNNPGTRVSAKSKASWDCRRDAYIQTISSSGAYKSTNRKVYSANTGCGSSKNI